MRWFRKRSSPSVNGAAAARAEREAAARRLRAARARRGEVEYLADALAEKIVRALRGT